MADEQDMRLVDPDGREWLCGSMAEYVDLLAQGYQPAAEVKKSTKKDSG